MPYATIDEAWGNVKPYVNKNTIIEPDTNNIGALEPKEEKIRVRNELPEITNLNNKYSTFETRVDSSIHDLKNEISRLNRKLDNLLQQGHHSPKKLVVSDTFLNQNMNDLILYVIFGLMVMLIIDIIFKLTRSKLLGK